MALEYYERKSPDEKKILTEIGLRCSDCLEPLVQKFIHKDEEALILTQERRGVIKIHQKICVKRKKNP